MNRFRKLVPLSTFSRAVAILASGTIGGQILVIVASPVLTRLYAPADFGVLAVFSAMLGIATVVAGFRYEFAIYLPETDERAIDVLALAGVGIVAFTALLALFLWLIGDDIATMARAPILASFLWLLPVGVFATAVTRALQCWCVRKREYGRLARTKFTEGIIAVAVQIALAGLSGPLGLMVGKIAGESAGMLTLGRLAWRDLQVALPRLSIGRLLHVAVRYRRFPQYSSWASLINAGGFQVAPLLLAAFYGAEVAGWFMLGERVVALPTILLGASISHVFIGESVRLFKDRRDEVMKLFWRTATALFVMGLPIMVTAALIAPAAFEMIFGSGWRPSGDFVRLLSVMSLARFVAAPLGSILGVVERQEYQLLREIVRLVLLSAPICIAFSLGADVYGGVLALSIGGACAYLFSGVLAWYSIRQAVSGKSIVVSEQSRLLQEDETTST